MSDAPAVTTTVIAPAHPPQPRWIALVTVIIAILGFASVAGGAILTIGAWRAGVDLKVEEIDKRLTKAEANQDRYIPVLLSMVKDVSFLAERARREDDARAREDRR